MLDSLGPISSKTLQSTIAAAYPKVTQEAGCRHLYWWHKIIFFMHSYCKLIVNIAPVYNTSILSSTGVQTLMYVHTWTLCIMSLTWVFRLSRSWISKFGKFLLKLRVHHWGKFAPRENMLLYSDCKYYTTQANCT